MSTDIAMMTLSKAPAEAQTSKSALTIVCLWAVVGLVLTVLMSHFGFDAEIAAALAAAS